MFFQMKAINLYQSILIREFEFLWRGFISNQFNKELNSL